MGADPSLLHSHHPGTRVRSGETEDEACEWVCRAEVVFSIYVNSLSSHVFEETCQIKMVASCYLNVYYQLQNLFRLSIYSCLIYYLCKTAVCLVRLLPWGCAMSPACGWCLMCLHSFLYGRLLSWLALFNTEEELPMCGNMTPRQRAQASTSNS